MRKFLLKSLALNFTHPLITNYSKVALPVFATLMFSAPHAWACSCMKKLPSEYLEKCDQLFIANLQDVSLEAKDGPMTKVMGHFSSPSHVIKGDPSLVKGISNTRMGTSCDMYLQVGEDYVVCGSGSEYAENSMCGYTHAVPDYLKSELIKLLPGGAPQKSE